MHFLLDEQNRLVSFVCQMNGSKKSCYYYLYTIFNERNMIRDKDSDSHAILLLLIWRILSNNTLLYFCIWRPAFEVIEHKVYIFIAYTCIWYILIVIIIILIFNTMWYDKLLPSIISNCALPRTRTVYRHTHPSSVGCWAQKRGSKEKKTSLKPISCT